MAPAAAATSTEWSTGFDTARRHRLFQNPPKDKTAYPALAAAVDPHINSFNSIFEKGGQLDQAIRDIGTKVFLDGDLNAPEDGPRNRLQVRIQEVFLDKSTLPQSNKFALKNRNILPAECRERHATYRGKLRARIEYRVNNGDWVELVRELGQVPIMLRVSIPPAALLLVWLLIALVTVEPVPPRGHDPRPARQGQGRNRGARRILYRQRYREDHTDVAS
jgi:DNA-directed RNA polymerase I subunit RPA2